MILSLYSLSSWNEWLTFPVKFSDLPRDAILSFTMWDSYGPNKPEPVGGTALSIFGKYGSMRRGIYDLKVWPNIEAAKDGSTSGKSAQTIEAAKLNKVLCLLDYFS